MTGPDDNQMTGPDDNQRAELSRIEKAIAAEEPKLAAAIGEFNATIRAAYEKFLGLAAGYRRSRDEFEQLHSEIGSAMMEFAGEAGDDWQQGDDGQKHLERISTWLDSTSIPPHFERPRELTAPDPPLSAIIAGLQRKPDEATPTSLALTAISDASMEIDPEDEAVEPEEADSRYFEFSEGKSSKFWEVFCQGSEMTTRWGKIGTGGQTKTKSFATPEKAASETAKIVATKLKEGYVEKDASGTVSSNIPRSKSSNGWSESADPEPMFGKVLSSASDRKRRLFAVACCRRVEDWLVVESGLVLDMRVEDYQIAVAAAERFADGEATSRELGNANGNADDSAFCNLDIKDATSDEMRKACYGDDAGWTARVREMPDEDRRAMEALPDPAAWFADEDHAGDLPAGVDPFRDVAGADATEVGETVGRQVLLLARTHGGRAKEAEERAAQAALIRDVFGDPLPPPAFNPEWRTPEVTALAGSIYEDKAFDRLPILGDALEEAGCDDTFILGHCRGKGPHVRGCWVLDQVLGKE